jgi:hypothetical protein
VRATPKEFQTYSSTGRKLFSTDIVVAKYQNVTLEDKSWYLYINFGYTNKEKVL